MIQTLRQLNLQQIKFGFLAASLSDMPNLDGLKDTFHKFPIPLFQLVLLDDPTHPKETALTIQNLQCAESRKFYFEFSHLSALKEQVCIDTLCDFLQTVSRHHNYPAKI